jgi:XTP/dITP diphosphohydrolase
VKIVLATRNQHKVDEIRAILRPLGVELLSACDFLGAPDVVEDGDTFEANAIKKAVALANATGMAALADDSGLEVDALNGEPGVRSARYSGEGATDARNVAKLLRALVGRSARKARFRCVLALAEPSGRIRTAEGRCEGRIIGEPRGRSGFGYDPVFVPDGHEQTFAEMDSIEKNRISHRGRALAALRATLNKH